MRTLKRLEPRPRSRSALSSVRKVISRSKFTEQISTPQTEQNLQMYAHFFFLRVAEQFMEHLSTFNTVCTAFTSVQAEHRVKLRQPCADALHTRHHGLKMLILYSQKFHRTNVPSLEKWGKGDTFLTLALGPLSPPPD